MRLSEALLERGSPATTLLAGVPASALILAQRYYREEPYHVRFSDIAQPDTVIKPAAKNFCAKEICAANF
jgi:hypothetical protein